MDWLDDLSSANMDSGRLQAVLAQRPNLNVKVRLDRLAAHLTAGEDDDGRLVRSVLLVAHAGDGKTHFLRETLAQTTELDLHWFPPDGNREADLTLPGIHIFNDPSPAKRDLVLRFFGTAFGEGTGDPNRRFVASANRGLLRDLINSVDSSSPVGRWLHSAHAMESSAHWPDGSGRVAVPLDQRTLVPGPGGRVEEAPASRLLLALLRYAFEDTEPTPLWSPDAWAGRISVALAMLEASGHHVTFREVTALGAEVARALRSGESEAWMALFHEAHGSQTLLRVRSLLRRLDPARVATPEIDTGFSTLETRDHAVREAAWDQLVLLFRSQSDEVPRLPYQSAVPFLRLCERIGEANRRAVAVVRSLGDLETAEQQLASVLEETADKLRRCTVPADPVELQGLFRGLARVAWGAEAGTLSHDVLPLATPVQPGTAIGTARWRVLRAAVGLDRAQFSVRTVDAGPWVERALVLPDLVIGGPPGLGETPPLRLDLDLFDLLSRIGDSNHPAELGNRSHQVAAWLESVVKTWESAWSETRNGFVVFQTLIDGSDTRESVPLRPPRHGAEFGELRPEDAPVGKVLSVLNGFWPPRSRPELNLAVTPGACANALLVWAGLAPADSEPQIQHGTPGALREALGNGNLETLRSRTRYRTLAFPWSTHFLALVVDSDDRPDRRVEEVAALGASLARALRIDGRWRAGLRGAWARDEVELDSHPTSLLVHDWLSVGAAGVQLAELGTEKAPDPAPDSTFQDLLGRLLGPVPFSSSERWWLIGTLAAWALFNEGVREHHEVATAPLWLPAVDAARPRAAYEANLWGWLSRRGDAERPKGEIDAIAALGQAAGFLTPAPLLRRLNLSVSAGPGLVDLIRLAAWRVCDGRPEERTVERLQERLLQLGLFVRTGGAPVADRLPPGSSHVDTPESGAFEDALRAQLVSLSLLDTASDGASLIRSPWDGAR